MSGIHLATLLLFGFVTGIRHGFDIDHIAAISDMTASQRDRRKGLLFAILYSVGHGLVVVVIGAIVLLLGQQIPASLDRLFGRIVGVTLVLLGLYVLISIARHGSNFRVRSRWLLVFSAIQFGYHKLLHNFKVEHHHPKRKDSYGKKTSLGIGMIHGVGAETPTQIAALATLFGIGGVVGMLFLFFFVLGIVLSNIALSLLTTIGFMRTRHHRMIFAIVGAFTAALSVVVGIMFLLAKM